MIYYVYVAFPSGLILGAMAMTWLLRREWRTLKAERTVVAQIARAQTLMYHTPRIASGQVTDGVIAPGQVQSAMASILPGDLTYHRP